MKTDAGKNDAGRPAPRPSADTRQDGPAAHGTTPIPSESLLRGATEILIRHGEEIYRLRATSKGKLLLTK